MNPFLELALALSTSAFMYSRQNKIQDNHIPQQSTDEFEFNEVDLDDTNDMDEDDDDSVDFEGPNGSVPNSAARGGQNGGGIGGLTKQPNGIMDMLPMMFGMT